MSSTPPPAPSAAVEKTAPKSPSAGDAAANSPAALPGGHLNNVDAPGDTVMSLVGRFAFKSMAWVGIYLLGYFDFSIAWLVTPLFLTVLRSQWKKDRDNKLTAARQAALGNEKDMIEARIKAEDLPSWVFFPDKERAEWINSILQQLWPNVGHYVRKLISESIEPSVKTALDGYGLTGFKFERVVLGQIPPRITGIKVYDRNVSRNEIIMDMDLVFASDCDIKFTLGSKIKAKIMDFSLRGLLRVVFKPLVNDIPLIGGVQAYFLTQPEIDFDLGGFANAFDAPGLSNIIRKIVLEQIGYFMVLPHKYTMTLAQNVETRVLRCPDSAGVLRVRLHKATQLLKKDVGLMGMGKSDPYAVLTVGTRQVKTHKINNTVNPEWNFVADFPIEVVNGQQLTVEIFDHDDPGEDEFLGRATVQTSVVANKGEIRDMWVDLEDIDSGRAQLSLSWMETTLDKDFLERRRLEAASMAKEENAADDHLARCLLHVYVDSCKELVVNKNSAQKPSPLVEVKVGSGEHQQTFPKHYTTEPVFEQGFVFLVANPVADDLHVRVLDTRHKDNVIGYTTVRVSDIIKQPGMEFPNQPFHLKGGSHESSITLGVQVRALRDPQLKKKAPAAAPSAGQESKPEVKPEVSKPEAKPEVVPRAAEAEPGVPKPQPEPPVIYHDKSADKVDAPKNDDSKPADDKPPVSIDEMIANTVKPIVESAVEKSDMESLLSPLNQDPTQQEQLRRRTTQAAQQAAGTCGRVKLSLSYDQDEETLFVVVHRCVGLPGSDLPDPPDPYIKLYLLPERKSKTKRKTEVVKDSCSPVYDEKFDYDGVKAKDLAIQQLEVSVVDRKGIFSRSPLMGRAQVDLDNPALMEGVTEWYDLYEDEDDSD